MDAFRFRLRIFLLVFFTVIVAGTICFMVIENLDMVDALYFSIVTIATVGYGDIHPATQAGKIVAIIMIITGVGTFLGVVANATEMMLNRREKVVRMKKLNMIIGVFFSEVGNLLLAYISEFDPNLEQIKEKLVMGPNWSEKDFQRASNDIKTYSFSIDIQNMDLIYLRDYLNLHINSLLRMLENPYLMEHESFTDLLQAVVHVKEELVVRKDLKKSPGSDKQHLANDIKRAYTHLVREWLDYMKHLKLHYPYLYSLAMRTNPFDEKASPVIS